MKFVPIVLAMCILPLGAFAQTVSCSPTAEDGTEFVPSNGMVEGYVADGGKRYLYQSMKWDTDSRLADFKNNADATYEPDAIIYNYEGDAWILEPIDDVRLWSSDLPDAYLDTQFGDGSKEKAITIGSASATNIRAGATYRTHLQATAGPGQRSLIKLSAQRGRRSPASCTTTWCSYGCDSQSNLRIIPFSEKVYMPGCARYTWDKSGPNWYFC